MRLRNQIRLSAFAICFGFPFLAVYVYLLIADTAAIPSGWPLMLGVFVVAIAAYFACRVTLRMVTGGLLLRTSERCQRAFEDGDNSTGQRIAQEIVEAFSRRPEMARMAQADALLFRESYGDALAILEGVDAEKLPRALRPLSLNNWAWCEAQLGQRGKSIEHAREALAQAESLKSPVASHCRGTLGAALLLANRPSEALPCLLKAFEEHSRPRPSAINAYYLGTAYREMNQLEKARSWYERAVQIAPKSRFGARALASLRDLGVGGSSPDA